LLSAVRGCFDCDHRARVVQFLVEHLESEGRSDSPAMGALATMGGLSSDTETGTGGMQNGRMVANG
jgi:hypothetical protein